MTTIIIILSSILGFTTLMYMTWVFYLAAMMLIEKRKKLKKEGKDYTSKQKVWIYPVITFGLLSDFVLNFVSSIIFLEPPRYDLKEWLLTGRVTRWKNKGGTRGDFARFVCAELLDPFQIGGHCLVKGN